MDDGGSSLLILGLGDPHGLEGGKRAEDGSSDPNQELPLCGCDDLNLHGGGCKSGDFLAQSLRDAGIHGCSTTHHDVAIEIFTDVHIALQDGLVADLVEAGHFLADEHGLEEGFRAAETLRADGDGLSVGEFVDLVVLGGVIIG